MSDLGLEALEFWVRALHVAKASKPNGELLMSVALRRIRELLIEEQVIELDVKGFHQIARELYVRIFSDAPNPASGELVSGRKLAIFIS